QKPQKWGKTLPGAVHRAESEPVSGLSPATSCGYIDGMSDAIVVNEIYLSLQGESTFAGLPCVFVRLTACNLRCSYCDTAYAFTEGRKMSLTEIREEVARQAEPFARGKASARLPLVELTGGEPLLQG